MVVPAFFADADFRRGRAFNECDAGAEMFADAHGGAAQEAGVDGVGE